jgi:cyclohexanecarboxylate-CoA ligase
LKSGRPAMNEHSRRGLIPTHLDAGRAARWREAGAWTTELLSERFDSICEGHADQLAISDEGIELRFVDVADLVHRLAAGLAGLGIQEGDVVSFQLPTGWESVVITHACFRLGAVVNPIGPSLRAHELDQIIADASPRAMFLPASYRGRAGATVLDELAQRPDVAVTVRGPGGTHDWDALLGHEGATTPLARVDPTAVAMLMFTSGSTARPKGVLHGHADLLAEVDGLAGAHEMTSSDRLLVALPVTHVGGAVYGILLPMATGIRATLMEAWDPAEALRLIEDGGLTFVSGIPTYLEADCSPWAGLGSPPMTWRGRRPLSTV